MRTSLAEVRSGPRFYLAGDGHFGVVDLDRTETVAIDDRLRSPHPDQRGSARVNERTVITASRHGTVYEEAIVWIERGGSRPDIEKRERSE